MPLRIKIHAFGPEVSICARAPPRDCDAWRLRACGSRELGRFIRDNGKAV
jgi:hypothetical protein